MTNGNNRARQAGPYCNIDLGDVSLPLWIVEFAADGTCRSPETRERLVAEVAQSRPTDVFIFSHGWNNTFERAVDAYEKFVVGYHKLQQSKGLPVPDPYKPLLVGIYWPSIDLILPWEKGPDIAGPISDGKQEAIGFAAAVRAVADDLPPDSAARFQELAVRPGLREREARDVATLLATVYPADDEVDSAQPAASADDIMTMWSSLIESGFTSDPVGVTGPGSFGVAHEDRSSAGPETAGAVSAITRFDPRDIIRAFTVCKMKDRAGVVGSAGGSLLVRDLLDANIAGRLHLIGHSYGARLLLSAICANDLPRKVQSLLLLEPAVNYLCFARQIGTARRPGGYRSALTRVETPIMSTFSAKDKALHDFFHLVVRRRRDLGEAKIAALRPAPSIYAALGGWGPGGLDNDEAQDLPLMQFPQRYALDPADSRVYALNSTHGIASHSDVINEWTFWALYNEVMA